MPTEEERVTDLRLSPTMERHLRELAEVGEQANWGPESAGEWRCAEALERRGLLVRQIERGLRPYVLTNKGFAVGLVLRSTGAEVPDAH